MARRITPSQFRSQMQQIQNRQKQAVNRYNQAVRQQVQKVNAAINNYNREARSHNARVRADRQRLAQALSRLQTHTTVTTHVRFRASVDTMHRAYVDLERASESAESTDFQNRILDLSERENANSIDVMNALLSERDPGTPGENDVARLRETKVGSELRALSLDLDDRWRGALFSLHPQNPDASRHFCTSAREIFTSILEKRAPDDAVKSAIPACPLTQNGQPTRRARIHFALMQKGVAVATLEEFVHQDIENILELFTVFNDGTHGSAGRFELGQLLTIKNRVEDGIVFLHQIFV